MIRWATDYFAAKEVDGPRASIEWLLTDALGLKRLDLYLQHDRPLRTAELDLMRERVRRRARHEPIAYILGFVDFLGCRIATDPRVLIPRPETEEWVEQLLEAHPRGGLRLLDVGTGSGCIAIACKKHRPDWEVHALDIRPDTLAAARANAEANGTDIRFHEGDLFSGRGWPAGPFDLIVSNPPYIPESQRSGLDPQVREHEPAEALFCTDVDAVYAALARHARTRLAPGGQLWAELNEDHNPLETGGLGPGWAGAAHRDYAGKARTMRVWITC